MVSWDKGIMKTMKLVVFCFPSSNLEFSIVSLCIYKCFAFSAHRIDTSDRLPITFVHGDDAGTAAAFVAGNLVIRC